MEKHQNNNFNKIYFIVLVSVIIQSCFLIKTKYKITTEFIKCNKKIDQLFQVSKIKVDSLNSDSLPLSYYDQETAVLFVNNNSGRLSKKIYFKKEVDNYYWFYNNKTEHKILPIKIENNTWYKFSGLIHLGSPILTVFMYVDNEGNSMKIVEPFY